jgi:hypothetical protein
MRRIVTAREQVEMLSPWRREAFIKEAKYPQVWSGKAPYGYLPSGRARNRPPSVRRDPDDPDSEVIDPSEIVYKLEGDSVSAYHPNGQTLGNYSWEGGDGGQAHIGIAQVNPKYQAQGVAGGIIDHIREHHHPDLVHSGYGGVGSLSYQGRAGALRDLGNTEEEHNDYFNTTPYNYGERYPSNWGFSKTDAQQRAHDELMQQFEEDQKHPNFTGQRSDGSYSGNSDMVDEYGERHEYGYDSNGDYVGISDGNKDSDGYSEDGYNSEGYNRDGYNSDGYNLENRDEYGFHQETGLDRDGKTRHGYTPGGGQPPEGTVSMSQMAEYASSQHTAPTMYAVRHPGEVSPHSGGHHVGNGDTLYSSLDRAREVAYHPDDPSKDKNIVSVNHLDPDYLHTDATGSNPRDFHYAPDSPLWDAEDTASTPANLVHDSQRHKRILGDLGHGWSQSTDSPFDVNSGFDYTDPNSGRSGRMYHHRNGTWVTQHEQEFGRRTRQGQYDNHRDAADAIRAGTLPGPTMDQHALEVNNDYQASGEGSVDWEPHPNGQGLMARTPHGDLHVVQDSDTGRWNWHAGPHGSQPGDEGNMRSPLSDSLNSAAQHVIRTITNRPFHGGLGDELGEGWVPHPTAEAAYTRRLPSGNHAFVTKNSDGTYKSGIQRDNGRGQSHLAPIAIRNSPNLAQAKAFINHRESPVPASDLGEGWEDLDRGPRHFPTYLNESHLSGATAHVAWNQDQGVWRTAVNHGGNTYESRSHKTPQDAAAWASSLMDDLGKQ